MFISTSTRDLSMRNRRLHMWLVATTMCFTTHAVRGQASTPPAHAVRRVFALVAVPDSFPYRNADAVIVRRTTALPHDVILLRQSHADPRTIAEAAQTLQAERARHGDVPTVDRLVRVQAPRAQLRLGRSAESWAHALARKSSSDVPGIGRARAVGLLLRNDEVRVQDRQ